MSYKDRNKQREYQRIWKSNRRYVFFAEKHCVVCGSKRNLELDHIDRNTKVSHDIWSWNKKRQEEEISKCQILCHECHSKKTYNDLYANLPKSHGVTGYRNGCRCFVCREAQSRKNKLYRLKLRERHFDV